MIQKVNKDRFQIPSLQTGFSRVRVDTPEIILLPLQALLHPRARGTRHALLCAYEGSVSQQQSVVDDKGGVGLSFSSAGSELCWVKDSPHSTLYSTQPHVWEYIVDFLDKCGK